MLTEFCFLAALTLNEDERAVLRNEIDKWVKCFLPKLERESTRTEKCRLIASVERREFGDEWTAGVWRFCKFVGKNGIIYDNEKEELEKFKKSSFQKNILRRKLFELFFWKNLEIWKQLLEFIFLTLFCSQRIL